jgi:hypothetical protein
MSGRDKGYLVGSVGGSAHTTHENPYPEFVLMKNTQRAQKTIRVRENYKVGLRMRQINVMSSDLGMFCVKS